MFYRHCVNHTNCSWRFQTRYPFSSLNWLGLVLPTFAVIGLGISLLLLEAFGTSPGRSSAAISVCCCLRRQMGEHVPPALSCSAVLPAWRGRNEGEVLLLFISVLYKTVARWEDVLGCVYHAARHAPEGGKRRRGSWRGDAKRTSRHACSFYLFP